MFTVEKMVDHQKEELVIYAKRDRVLGTSLPPPVSPSNYRYRKNKISPMIRRSTQHWLSAHTPKGKLK